MEECSVLIETTKSAEDKTSRQFDYMDLQPEVQKAYKDLIPYFCYFVWFVLFTNFSQIISTHLLTVLTMRAIVQIEQRKGNKKKGLLSSVPNVL